MTDNIVKFDDFIARVREVAKEQTTLGQAFDCLKVAEELERLWTDYKAVQTAHVLTLKRLRAEHELSDQLAAALLGLTSGDVFKTDDEFASGIRAQEDALRAWQEARREG